MCVMKHLISLTMIFAALSLSACGQSNQVPNKVKKAFEQKFPNASKVSWDKENASEWEAEFKMNGEEFSANFKQDGTRLETEYEIEKSELPASVKQALNSEFKGYDIEEAEMSETVDGKMYEFELEKGERSLEVSISPQGEIQKHEVMERDEEDMD